jgi:hypothetical protein
LQDRGPESFIQYIGKFLLTKATGYLWEVDACPHSVRLVVIWQKLSKFPRLMHIEELIEQFRLIITKLEGSS